MRLLTLVLLLLLPATAQADLLADMQAEAKALLDWRMTGDFDADKAALLTQADRLHKLAAQANVFREEQPTDAWRGWLHLAEGELGFGRALLRAPCPQSLTEEQCTTYRVHLAGKASVWLRKGLDAVGNAEGMSGANEKQLGKLRATLVKLEAESQALAPPGDDGPWVAVREDAWFYAADGQKARVSGWDSPLERPPIRMRRLGEKDGRILVEVPARSPKPDTFHCLGPGPLHDGFNVQLSVDPADLVSVTAKPFTFEYEDGTWARLPEGVSVDAQGRPRIHDALLPIVIDPLYRQQSWTSEGTTSPYIGNGGELPLDSVLRLNGEPVTVDRDQVAIFPKLMETEGDVTFATFRSSCGEVRLTLDGEYVEPKPDENTVFGLGGVVGGGDDKRRGLGAGTKLWWPDGTAAGSLSSRQIVYETAEAPGGLRCWSQQMGYLYYEGGPPKDGALTLCVKAE
ncbi:MAG: hypothetical protein KDA24_28290 [Deltaproteobacteria bacterium]|nr:hypothetical protein [Deltaproteobacteria bacterium]